MDLLKFFFTFLAAAMMVLVVAAGEAGRCGRDGDPCKTEADCCTKLCDIRSKPSLCIGD